MDDASLAAAYAEYLKIKGGEISLELSRYLVSELKRYPDNAVLIDLGSGWSSFLMRKLCPKAKVWSVDDDLEWMLKSIRFCSQQGVHTDGFLTLDHAKNIISTGTADFVLHDLGNRTTRARELPWALKLVKHGSVVIIDDMHKKDLRERVNAELKKQQLLAENVGLDDLGRFSYKVLMNRLHIDMSNSSSNSKLGACIDALKATNDWRVVDCVSYLQSCPDVENAVLPASMQHLLPVVRAALKGVQ